MKRLMVTLAIVLLGCANIASAEKAGAKEPTEAQLLAALNGMTRGLEAQVLHRFAASPDRATFDALVKVLMGSIDGLRKTGWPSGFVNDPGCTTMSHCTDSKCSPAKQKTLCTPFFSLSDLTNPRRVPSQFQMGLELQSTLATLDMEVNLRFVHGPTKEMTMYLVGTLEKTLDGVKALP